MRNDCVIVVYTDDCCVFSRADTAVDQLIRSLADDGFLLKDEGNINDFLGVRINYTTEEDDSVRITMTQPGLIDSLLTDVGLIYVDTSTPPTTDPKTPSKTHSTPASEVLRHAPSDPPDYQPEFHYRSAIGKLNFIANNTRPDISYQVHQCARFVNTPTFTHYKAVKYLCRYLLKTRDRGLILRPDSNASLDAYVDSDFAGLWSADQPPTRQTCLSRAGYVILFCGCPVYWQSRLMTEIALSTTEAELMALSLCMRSLLPMRALIKELTLHFEPSLQPLSTAPACATTQSYHTPPPSTVYEDNAGCLALAMNPEQYRPRTKHIALKWFHFADQVKQGACVVKKIDTKENWADIFTKPLPKPVFEYLRRKMMGW
jgi:hypothetical protein